MLKQNRIMVVGNSGMRSRKSFTLYCTCIVIAVIHVMPNTCEAGPGHGHGQEAEPAAAVTVQKDSGCGSSVGCFHDCLGDTCTFLLTWVEKGDDIVFTLTCARSESDPYCAIGLSSNAKMEDDSVFECLSDHGTANVYVSYNPGHANSRLDQNQYGLSSISTSYSNGILACNFNRKKTFALAAGRKRRHGSQSHDAPDYTPTSASTFFDMNTDWYLLYAYGTNSGGVLKEHTAAPLISNMTADFQSTDDISATAIKRPLIKAHGILMVFAWVLFSTIGMFTARFYKTAWPEQVEWLSAKPWFLIHRVCMISTLLLTLTAFIIIFVDVGEYVQIQGSTLKKTHPVLGIIVMSFALINPVMAVFRPEPGTPKRIIFRVAHTFVGVAGQILATINLFTGTDLDAIEISSNARIALGVYCGWVFAVEIGLGIYDYVVCNKGKSKTQAAGNTTEAKTKEEIELQNSRKASSGKSVFIQGKYNKLKMVVLVVHILAVSALSIAVSTVIGSAE